MKVDLAAKDWKWLCYLTNRGPTYGRDLRFGCGPQRADRDARRFRDLLALGLIARTDAAELPRALQAEADGSRFQYAITDAGRAAAQSGTYERPASHSGAAGDANSRAVPA